jgi:hypothetical protein
MPQVIPIYIDNRYVTSCFSDDSLNRLSFVLEQCGCFIGCDAITYMSMDNQVGYADMKEQSNLVLSYLNIKSLFANCDDDFIKSSSLTQSITYSPTNNYIDVLSEKTIDFLATAKKPDFLKEKIDSLSELKTKISLKYNDDSYTKHIHEMVSYAPLILKVHIDQIVDKHVINAIWSTIDLNNIYAIKKIVKHGKKEHYKEMKIIKKEYYQSEIDGFKNLWCKDELYTIYQPDKNRKETILLYIYTDSDMVIILEEGKNDIYILVKNKKHIYLKQEFNTTPKNWNSFFNAKMLNILNNYMNLDYSLVNVQLKHTTINYDAFISISDLHLTMENQAWLKYFFTWPETNTMHYRPHYQTKEIDINTDISLKIQQIDKKNCVRFIINVPENSTFLTVKDVIQVLYFLLEPNNLQHSSIGKLNYKEFDPYLFKENIRKGGYTRQCTDYWDRKIVDVNGKRIKRKKVPRILISKADNDAYNSIPDEHKKYKLYYRGNYFAAIDDYIENNQVIEPYNANLAKGKKKELYLNTVVLFPIQDKYQKENEKLFYPECVRAKSGMPMAKHQFILKKLLDDGEIDIIGGNADFIKKKLQENQDLQRADLVYYISRIGTKLKGFSMFGTLPLVVNKFFCMAENLANSNYLTTFIRKIAINGENGFLDACLDALDDRYKKATIEEKSKHLIHYKRVISEWIQQHKPKFESWVRFGNLDLTKMNMLKHNHSIDIIGMYFNVNIFVLELKNENFLKKLDRTMLYNSNVPSIFILYWEGKGYEIVFKSNDDDSGKEIKREQFLFKKSDHEDIVLESKSMQNDVENDSHFLAFLCRVFEEHSVDAAKLKMSHEISIQVTDIFNKKVVGQFVNFNNKTVGLIMEDEWMLPIFESPPIPNLNIRKTFRKSPPQTIVGKLMFLSRSSPGFKIMTQIINDNNVVIAFLLQNGLICPIEESQFFKIDCPTINQKLIPYIEGITHFSTENILNYGDARTSYMNVQKKKKYRFALLLKELHPIFKMSEYANLWKEIFNTEPTNSNSLEKLFNLLISTTSQVIVESVGDETFGNTLLEHGENTERLFKFVNYPNEQFSDTTLKRLIFQTFHYLKNHPNFISSSIDIQIESQNNDNIIVIDSNSIKSGVTFEESFSECT